MNVNNEEYSDERMIEFFKEHASKSGESFINAMVKDTKSFVGEAVQSDDITTLILKKL
jgi:serine phosphatase RsbU (regulator of sigma subunit)